jgi:hypothetical protein
MSIILALGRPMEEGFEFEMSLGYIARLMSQKKEKKKPKEFGVSSYHY